QPSREGREAPLILFQARRLTQLLADHDFVVNQLQRGFRIRLQLGIPQQVGFRANPLAALPATALLASQCRDRDQRAQLLSHVSEPFRPGPRSDGAYTIRWLVNKILVSNRADSGCFLTRGGWKRERARSSAISRPGAIHSRPDRGRG